jgi:hypothetical protein
MGSLAILLIISFSAYQLTTYDSIRGVIGGIAEQPSLKVILSSQYSDMVKYFSENKGDVFVYDFGGIPVSISKSQVQGLEEKETLSIVLDSYAANLYHVKYTGILGGISDLIGASGNKMLSALTIVIFMIFMGVLMASFLPNWELSFPVMLKSAGKFIAIMCAVSFIVFLLMPGIVKSMVYGSIPASDYGRDIMFVLESKISGTILANNLIMIVLGMLLYGAGYYLIKQNGEAQSISKPSEKPVKAAPNTRVKNIQAPKIGRKGL